MEHPCKRHRLDFHSKSTPPRVPPKQAPDPQMVTLSRGTRPAPLWLLEAPEPPLSTSAIAGGGFVKGFDSTTSAKHLGRSREGP